MYLGVAKEVSLSLRGIKVEIIKKDIKATNVLLDRDLNAMISDFGLAKKKENKHVNTRTARTMQVDLGYKQDISR